MNPIRAAVDNRQVVFLVTALIVLLGLDALFDMPRREDPRITIRQGLVLALLPGATAEQVEQQVARPIEQRLFAHEEVRKAKTYTTSREGMLVANVELEESVDDPDRFWAMLRHDVNELRATTLPAGVIGPIVNSDFGDVSAVLVTLHGAGHSVRELDAHLDRIDDALRAVAGVSKIRRSGEQREEIAVTLRPERLAQYGIAPAQVMAAIGQRTGVAFGGSVPGDEGELVVRPGERVASVADVRAILVGTGPTRPPVTLGDVAGVERRYADPSYRVRTDGEEAVLLSVEMQEGRNIVAFGHDVHAALERVRATLPADLVLSWVADQPQMVEERVLHFGREFGIAVVAVILVTVLLLPLRVAAIAAIAIPVTVAVTLAVLRLAGIELHQITFAGLVVALGMVVDDAIVVADNYVEQLDHGMTRREAAWRGATQLAAPVLGATLTIVASFLPLAILLPGAVGEFIRALPLTVSISLLCSYVVAMFLTPVLAMMVIRTGLVTRATDVATAGEARPRRSLLDVMRDLYDATMRVALPRPWLTLGVSAAAVVAGVLMLGARPQRFFPSAERDQFVVDVWTPEGSAFERTDAVARRLEGAVAATAGVRSVSAFVGGGAPRFYYNVNPETPTTNYAQLVVHTASPEATSRIATTLERSLAPIAPEARVRVRELEQGAPLAAPIEIRIAGDDLATLRALADTVAGVLRATPGAAGVHDDWHGDVLGVSLALRDDVAARLGLTERTVAEQLAGGLEGAPAATVWEGNRRVDVRVRFDPASRASPGALRDAYVISPGTYARIPLREVASLEPEWQPARIVRRNGVRTITVRAHAEPGVLASTVRAAAQPGLDGIALPAGYALRDGGEVENQAEVQGPMGVALGVSLLGIFVILFFQFRNVSLPLIVMASIPLALFGSALGLVLTGNPIGFTANIGITALTGVVVRNAIILVDCILELRRAGATMEQAALDAGRRRLRPIFLTTMAAAAGVVPMIVSGSTLWSPLASVLAVGLLCSMMFTLVVVPILWVLVERRAEARRAVRQRHDRTDEHAVPPGILLPGAGAALALLALSLAAPAPVHAQGAAAAGDSSGRPRAGSAAAPSLALDDAVAKAVAASRATRIAAARVDGARSAARAARTDLLPRLATEATYLGRTGRTSFVIPAGALGTDAGGGPLPADPRRFTQEGTDVFYGLTTLSQPLTPLLRVRQGVRAAEALAQERTAEREQMRLDIAFEATRLYLGALLAARRRESAAALQEAREARCRDAEEAVRTGSALRTGLEEARAGALEARHALLAATYEEEDLRGDLNDLMGVPRDARWMLRPPAADDTLESREVWVARALAAHPALAAASARVEQAQAGVRAAKAERVPDLAVFARHIYQDALDPLPRSTITGGAQLSWTVVDFGRRGHVREEREAGLRAAREALAMERERVIAEVEKRWHDASRAEVLVGAAAQALVARREAERVAGANARAGFTLASLRQEASATRAAAESAELEARVGMWLARAALRRAAGGTDGAGGTR